MTPTTLNSSTISSSSSTRPTPAEVTEEGPQECLLGACPLGPPHPQGQAPSQVRTFILAEVPETALRDFRTTLRLY